MCKETWVSLDFLVICGLLLVFPLEGAKEYWNAVNECPPCEDANQLTVQEKCHTEQQTLSGVDNEFHNNSVVCLAFESYLTCVAKEVPRCLEKTGEQYKQYRWSPRQCPLDDEHVKMFQMYVKKGCYGYTSAVKSNYSVHGNTGKSGFTTYQLNETSTNSSVPNIASDLQRNAYIEISLIHLALWTRILLS